MSAIKSFKKGDFIFKEGDKASAIYLLQTGSVSLCLTRAKKNIELFSLTGQHVVGEQCLQGAPSHTAAALCTTDVKAIEIPIEEFRAQLGSSQQAVQLVFKSMVERAKAMTAELRSSRLERDPSPVPEDQVARALGAAFHAAQYRGKAEGNQVVVSWLAYRQHAQRIFGESPKRLEQLVMIFTKLKLATIEKGKEENDPDGPEVLLTVRFSDLGAVETAADFFQHWYFKGGRADLLKVEEGPFSLVVALIKVCEGHTPNRHGVISLDYGQLLERMKAEFDIAVKPDHWARLEQKGLFARLKQGDGKVSLEVEIAEFKRALQTWRILREIERLNERGFVDMNEDDSQKKKASAGGAACPSCSSEIIPGQKFCGNCGHKLAAAA